MGIDFDIYESSIEREVVYPHPRERVWRALTESDLLADWLMENDLEAVEAGETFEFHADPMPPLWDGTVRCEVLAVEPPRELSISWYGGGINPETTVTWTLEAVDDGTRLHFAHEGLSGLRGFLMKRGMSGGWESMFEESLPAVLDRLAGEQPAGGGG